MIRILLSMVTDAEVQRLPLVDSLALHSLLSVGGFLNSFSSEDEH